MFFKFEKRTYRPREVEREDDGIAESLHVQIWNIERVPAQHRRGDVAERAWRRRVDIRLVNLETHAEFSPARR